MALAMPTLVISVSKWHATRGAGAASWVVFAATLGCSSDVFHSTEWGLAEGGGGGGFETVASSSASGETIPTSNSAAAGGQGAGGADSGSATGSGSTSNS